MGGRFPGMLPGLALGSVCAVLDVLLMRRTLKRTALGKNPRGELLTVFLLRYLIPLAAVGLALFVPAINAAGIIPPLLAGKVFLILSLARNNR